MFLFFTEILYIITHGDFNNAFFVFNDDNKKLTLSVTQLHFVKWKRRRKLFYTIRRVVSRIKMASVIFRKKKNVVVGGTVAARLFK